MRANLVRALSLVPLLLAAACAGREERVFRATDASAPGARAVSMLVTTTRTRDADPDRLFTGERARQLSFANVEVSVPPDSIRTIGEVQWPKQVPADPATEFATRSARVIGLPEAQATLGARLRANGHGHVLVFVHGYNSKFSDATFRLAQIAHDSRAPAVPVLFTWPSRGKLLDYGYDRESANYSRDALEGVLTALDRNPAVKEISILAHSMGNWLTLEALRQMAIRSGRLAGKINDVMLAAPDVDIDVFRTQINQIGQGRARFTLFASRDDRALKLSTRLWGSAQRLGAVDPAQEPYRSDLARDRIAVVDLTEIRTGDKLNHGKFAESPTVVRMIGQRLAEGQTLHAGRPASLTERLGQVAASGGAAIGSAAAAIVTAPLAIVDPAERETFGDHLHQAGKHSEGAIPD